MPLDNLKCPACGRKKGHRKSMLVPGPAGNEWFVEVPVVTCSACSASSIDGVVVRTREPGRSRTLEAKTAIACALRKLATEKRSEIRSLESHLAAIELEAQRLELETRSGVHADDQATSDVEIVIREAFSTLPPPLVRVTMRGGPVIVGTVTAIGPLKLGKRKQNHVPVWLEDAAGLKRCLPIERDPANWSVTDIVDARIEDAAEADTLAP